MNKTMLLAVLLMTLALPVFAGAQVAGAKVGEATECPFKKSSADGSCRAFDSSPKQRTAKEEKVPTRTDSYNSSQKK